MESTQEFDFEIQYVKGNKHVVSNSLYISFVSAMSLVIYTIFEIIKGFHTDDVYLSIQFKILRLKNTRGYQ